MVRGHTHYALHDIFSINRRNYCLKDLLRDSMKGLVILLFVIVQGWMVSLEERLISYYERRIGSDIGE